MNEFGRICEEQLPREQRKMVSNALEICADAHRLVDLYFENRSVVESDGEGDEEDEMDIDADDAAVEAGAAEATAVATEIQRKAVEAEQQSSVPKVGTGKRGRPRLSESSSTQSSSTTTSSASNADDQFITVAMRLDELNPTSFSACRYVVSLDSYLRAMHALRSAALPLQNPTNRGSKQQLQTSRLTAERTRVKMQVPGRGFNAADGAAKVSAMNSYYAGCAGACVAYTYTLGLTFQHLAPRSLDA
jgi:hypothetical protein